MSQTRFNKIVTITNDEVYDLASHMARMADSANVIIKVASAAERDALAALAPGGVLPTSTTVMRTDLTGHPLEKWDGTKWNRTGSLHYRWNRNAGSDASFTTPDTNLVSGTITDAPPGLWRIEGFLGLYGSTAANGYTFVSVGASPAFERRRQDLNTLPSTYYVNTVYTHTGGNLVLNAGYDRDTGTATVMAGGSGDSSLIATFLGT